MEKKRSSDKLKPKGAYLPESEMPEQDANSVEAPLSQPVPPQIVRMPVNPRTFERSKWRHYLRWTAFIIIVFLDIGLVVSGVKAHLLSHKALTMQGVFKEAFLFLLMGLCNLTVLPSIVLEANKVSVSDACLELDNLLFRCTIPWSDVRWVSAPIFLKFAIVKTPRFFQLINKRDIPDFTDLIETIQMKAGEASK